MSSSVPSSSSTMVRSGRIIKGVEAFRRLDMMMMMGAGVSLGEQPPSVGG